MKIIVVPKYDDKDVEFEVADKYFNDSKVGLDKALIDLIAKSKTINIQDVPRDFEIMGRERGMRDEAIVKQYVKNTYDNLIYTIRVIIEDCLVDNSLLVHERDLQNGLNDILIKYCGFSLYQYPTTLGQYACAKVHSLVSSISDFGENSIESRQIETITKLDGGWMNGA